MKGLTLSCMDRKSEAYELVRLGLKVNPFPRPEITGKRLNATAMHSELIPIVLRYFEICHLYRKDPSEIMLHYLLAIIHYLQLGFLLQIFLLEGCGLIERALHLEELRKKEPKIVNDSFCIFCALKYEFHVRLSNSFFVCTILAEMRNLMTIQMEALLKNMENAKGKNTAGPSSPILPNSPNIHINESVEGIHNSSNRMNDHMRSFTPTQHFTKLQRAKLIFVENVKFKAGFKFDHVWNMLKDIEKFLDNDTTRRQVCGKDPSDYSSSQSDNQTPDCNTPESPGFPRFSMNLNDGISDSSYERPIGVKKAKLKKKIGEQRKKDSNMLDEEIKEMMRNAEAERLQLIELQQQQLYVKQQHRLFKQQQAFFKQQEADVKQKDIDIAREDKILEKYLSSISDPTGGQGASFNTYVDFVLFGSASFVQHYDRRGQYEVALRKIDEAIEHTPTVIDLYSVKVIKKYSLLSCNIHNNVYYLK
ncbi:hypothetical protein BUALT_Bualt02G0113000 [Buddleja alternifolia]|uniref:No apical meristem-associated C-terminal domain-containing protein n=1 Tax=Buddleja alternifolia TaxID=168488 RepID=A0AAV6Y5L8_9LAMI|nr:hypothetical protein BUALT_Bualt02G0113000 [Buddleja alternifolia]